MSLCESVCAREKEIIITTVIIIMMMMEICKAPNLRLKDRGTACVCECDVCVCTHICGLCAVMHVCFSCARVSERIFLV